MKLYLRILCAAAAMVMLGSCGGEDSKADSGKSSQNSETAESSQTEESEVTAKEVLSAIDNELLDGDAYYGEETFDNNCPKLYGIEADKLTDGGIIFATSGGNADEISMIKPADGKGKQILESRLSSRSRDFETYKPEEMPKIDSAEIFSAGGYDVLIISEDASSLKKTIEEALEG